MPGADLRLSSSCLGLCVTRTTGMTTTLSLLVEMAQTSSKHDPPNLHLLSSWDYRYASPGLAQVFFNWNVIHTPFTFLKWTIQCFIVYPWSCVTSPQSNSRTFSSPQKKNKNKQKKLTLHTMFPTTDPHLLATLTFCLCEFTYYGHFT
jgi:hypothetical protein